MRINERNYPSYLMLQKGEILDFPFDTDTYYHLDAKLGDDKSKMKDFVKTMVDVFKGCKNKFFLTDTFHDALVKSHDKIIESMTMHNDYSSNIWDSCIIMHKNGFAMHQTGTNNGEPYSRFYVFSRDRLIGYGLIPISASCTVPYDGFLSNFVTDPKSELRQLFESYLLVLYFITECEIETHIVKPKEKIRLDGVKYYNEDGKSPITILDCRWFTELIINTPFGVKGHLRWQPVGEGRSKRKLIWIESFEKKGYHRKAKKEVTDL